MRSSPQSAGNLLISLAKPLVLAIIATATLYARNAAAPENNLTVAEQYLFAAANEARANQGLAPLHLDPVLTEASLAHAREMANHAAISHQFNEEADLAERGAQAGAHFSLISENVGEAPTSVIIHDLWMHSPDTALTCWIQT